MCASVENHGGNQSYSKAKVKHIKRNNKSAGKDSDAPGTKGNLTTAKMKATISQLMTMRNQRKTPQPGLQKLVTASKGISVGMPANTTGLENTLWTHVVSDYTRSLVLQRYLDLTRIVCPTLAQQSSITHRKALAFGLGMTHSDCRNVSAAEAIKVRDTESVPW